MKNDLPEDNALNRGNVDPESILADWLTAVYDLYNQFEKLNACIYKEVVLPNLRPELNHFIGQCAAHQLITLSIAIQTEIERLIQEMEQLSGIRVLTVDRNYQKLVSHTHTLNQLSQQARTKLHLTTLPRL